MRRQNWCQNFEGKYFSPKSLWSFGPTFVCKIKQCIILICNYFDNCELEGTGTNWKSGVWHWINHLDKSSFMIIFFWSVLILLFKNILSERKAIKLCFNLIWQSSKLRVNLRKESNVLTSILHSSSKELSKYFGKFC